MSITNQAANEFRETILHDYAEFRKALAIDLSDYDPNDRENFALVIWSALKEGVKLEYIAEMAMTPVYNVKRWMKGTHCPPMLVRKTVADGVCKSLQNSSVELLSSGLIMSVQE